MKYKGLFSTILMATMSSSLFAGFTITDAVGDEKQNPKSGGVLITGSGSVDGIISTGGKDEYYFIKTQGTNINFDSDSVLKTTATNVQLGTSLYSMSTSGNASTWNFTGKGGLSLANGSSVGGLYIKSALTINIAEGAGGMNTGKVAVAKAGVTLNINKKNGFYSSTGIATQLCLVATTANINLTADQAFSLDFRNGSGINLSATSDANLIFTKIGLISGTNPTTKINFTEDFAGSLLIDTDLIDSFDKEDKQIVLRDSDKTMTLNISAVDGFDWSTIEWVENYEYEGNTYLKIGAISAAVPEPAEWAVILGSLALGLAIYRKRK